MWILQVTSWIVVVLPHVVQSQLLFLTPPYTQSNTRQSRTNLNSHIRESCGIRGLVKTHYSEWKKALRKRLQSTFYACKSASESFLHKKNIYNRCTQIKHVWIQFLCIYWNDTISTSEVYTPSASGKYS